jgi:hypothetical protein
MLARFGTAHVGIQRHMVAMRVCRKLRVVKFVFFAQRRTTTLVAAKNALLLAQRRAVPLLQREADQADTA